MLLLRWRNTVASGVAAGVAEGGRLAQEVVVFMATQKVWRISRRCTTTV